MPISLWRLTQAAVLALLITLAGVPVSAESNESPDPTDETTGDWIIELDSGWAQFNSFSALETLLGDAEYERLDTTGQSYVASFDGDTSASDTVARLLGHPAIEYIEPDIIYDYQETFTPNDPYFNQQTWAETVNVPGAWSVTSGSSDVTVAVIDSGIRDDHPDLQGKLTTGYNYVEDNRGSFYTNDHIGHGTAVAGIIAATGDNSEGIAGTAMNVKLMPIRVGNQNGAPVSQIAAGIEHAVNNGADVINLSLGAESPSARLENSLEYAEANDVVVVAAAGNQADKVSFPGTYPSTISVGATTEDGAHVADFSSRVSVVDIVAPGENVISSHWSEEHGNTYASNKGTSFATPMVSGAAALIRSINPELDVHEVRTILRETTQDRLDASAQGAGAGLLDVSAAVRQSLVPSYASNWLTADEPVFSLATERSWLWGPHGFNVRAETYADAENGLRLVAYYDKARMEITDPYGDRNNDWYVTNGLLVSELITGEMQVGDNEFVTRDPSTTPVAGDPEDNDGPTYATFTGLIDAEPLASGDPVTHSVSQDGSVGDDSRYAEYGVTAEEYIPETDHRIASVFWEYLNSEGLLRQNGQYNSGRIFNPTFFATGFPITEAYWTTATVGGENLDVLVQCFERRCLTYTPANPDNWQVEMGNVGQHYYRWRYGAEPGGADSQDPTSYAIANLR